MRKPVGWDDFAARFNLVAAREYPFASARPTRALLAAESCRQRLTQLSPLLRSPSLAITASLLSKRLAFLTTAAACYPMSIFDGGLDLSLDNCLLDTRHDGHLWQSHLPLCDLSLSSPQAFASRDAWRDTVIAGLFARHLTPLWQQLAAVSGISTRILWENTAVRLFSLYEHRMEAASASVQQRAQRDFRYLVHDAPGALFGLADNPLTPFYRPLTRVPASGDWVRFRRTCCFYYKASHPVEYCQACPLMRPGKGVRAAFRNTP